MSVITFSQKFPVKHPRKGEPTYFVEAVLSQLGIDYTNHEYFLLLCDLNRDIDQKVLHEFYENLSENIPPKSHTIRVGTKRKVGQEFSPRVWSGKPYQTKQIIFAPDIEVVKLWNIQIISYPGFFHIYLNGTEVEKIDTIKTIANNDGLSLKDFEDWFTVPSKNKSNHFAGQVICWSEKISYEK